MTSIVLTHYFLRVYALSCGPPPITLHADWKDFGTVVSHVGAAVADGSVWAHAARNLAQELQRDVHDNGIVKNVNSFVAAAGWANHLG